uniref:Androgen-dependent TFPI-regulating protein n=1 Tax=Clastoptera arizonana TaxID=38151 RepID=A0A1B6CZW9_9HEMI
MALLVPAFHAGVAVYNVIVTKWLKENMLQNLAVYDSIIIQTMKRFSLRFFTNWTFTLLTLYILLCVFEDIVLLMRGAESFKSKLKKVKNFMFTVVVAPMTVFVSVVFWGLWSLDRELIFPKEIDPVLPPWVNHSLHTTTSVIVFIEMLITPHQYPKFRDAVIGISSYLALYLICLLWTYFESGIWLYPVFKIANWPIKIVLFASLFLLAISLYSIQQFISSLRWVEKQKPKPSKKKTKRH